MEQQILDTFKTLPTPAQQEILHFVEFIAQKYDGEAKPDEVERDENGWPVGFFEKIAGSWEGDLVRPPQGKLQERDPLL